MKSKRLANLLVGSLFLAGLSITSALLSERVLADIKCPVRTPWGSKEELCPHIHLPSGNLAQAESEVGCPQCNRSSPSISGIYRGINIWGVLRVTASNNSAFSADDNNENQYFTHLTKGTLVSRNGGEVIWNITTKRTNRSNGCTTMMSGILTQRSNNTARAVYTGTDGRCDIPTNFSAVVELSKN
ncbi:hypothetical protein [Planktothrix paucivesiculata]|uniref:hypothetical protein n=1 Tax=Planktothrix paucivesiculata TaxID=1678308 RepID=UPI0012DE2B76|nr:hypothetical protein [Planktothrix paucivesiculata]